MSTGPDPKNPAWKLFAPKNQGGVESARTYLTDLERKRIEEKSKEWCCESFIRGAEALAEIRAENRIKLEPMKLPDWAKIMSESEFIATVNQMTDEAIQRIGDAMGEEPPGWSELANWSDL